jgi:ComF family protein
MWGRVSGNTRTWRRAFLDFLFPPRCVVCRGAGEWLCPGCQAGIEKIESPFCGRCGYLAHIGPCPYGNKSPMHMDGVRALAYFESGMREAIHAFKYNHRVELAPIFGSMLQDYLRLHTVPADTLVPVPLHAEREQARGYNQSLLLANELGALTCIHVLPRAIQRVRATHPQFELNALERRANVRGAFVADASVAGARVLLIDDICTTGATMDECTIALRNQGVQSVWGLALAHARQV